MGRRNGLLTNMEYLHCTVSSLYIAGHYKLCIIQYAVFSVYSTAYIVEFLFLVYNVKYRICRI